MGEPADPRLIEHLARTLPLPAAYWVLLAAHNGGEIEHDGLDVILWRAEELEEFNRDYRVEEFAPGVFLVGTSGGGEAYGFDLANPECPFIRIPFIPLDREYIERVSGGFAAIAAAFS